jgi:phenylacetate-CoA ligase
VKVSENYSANETGYIAFRCAEGALHIQSEGIVVEIIDEKGAPCGAGQGGKVVITPLHNLAMPLIRYEIGDIATVGSACSCGRALPVISQVVGRVRNVACAPDGTRFWPVDLGKLREVKVVRQFQYVQAALDVIQLRVVLDRPLSHDEGPRIVELVRAALGYPFKVEIVPVPRIDRGPSGKFEEFLSLLPPK